MRPEYGYLLFIVLVAGLLIAGNFLAHTRHYTSTACLHHFHAECRKFCKFCQERCRCECHDEDGQV